MLFCSPSNSSPSAQTKKVPGLSRVKYSFAAVGQYREYQSIYFVERTQRDSYISYWTGTVRVYCQKVIWTWLSCTAHWQI